MNYQSIRAQVENPLLTAFGALDPAIPVFFDNITAAPLNSTTEYVRVNVLIGSGDISAANAVDKLESSPPLRKNPIGTSDIIRRSTPCRSNSSNRSVRPDSSP